MASVAWRAMAGPEATVSRQPRWPHEHVAPAGSTTMWPISPAMPALAEVESSVQHEPGPDPGPDRDVGQVADPARDLVAEQARGGRADVVADRARDAELGREAGGERDVVPAEVRGVADDAVGLDPAGHPDADGHEVAGRAGRLERGPDGGDDRLDRRPARSASPSAGPPGRGWSRRRPPG